MKQETLLILVATLLVATALHLPFFGSDLQEYKLPKALSDPDELAVDVKPESEQDAWLCDIRVWVRAPDLYPGSVLPAEARLAANGSDCRDVVG
jgi:hypothetical protein